MQQWHWNVKTHRSHCVKNSVTRFASASRILDLPSHYFSQEVLDENETWFYAD